LVFSSFGSNLAAVQEKGQESKQEKKDTPELALAKRTDLVTRIFKLRHADPNSVAVRVMSLFGGMAIVTPEMQSRIVAVRALPEALPSIEELIKQADSPPPVKKNIQITVFLLMAKTEPGSEASLPDQLQPVVRQLKNTFTYQSYQLLETIISRTREGEGAEMSGVFPSNPADPSSETQSKKPMAIYKFSCGSVKLSPEERTPIVQIDRLKFGAALPIVTPGYAEGKTQIDYRDTGITTNLDVREGQMAIVGKTSADGSPNALIIVLTAKVID
jgi:hypothetical protein